MSRGKMLQTWTILLCGIMICNFSLGVQAAERTINVYFEGKLIQFEDTQPIIKDSRTLVPFRKIFETLGYSVEWIDNGTEKKAIGTKGSQTIELTINSADAKVSNKIIALDVPAQTLNGRTVVPLRFVSENSGFIVAFKNEGGVMTIGIGATEESANLGVTTGQATTPAPDPAPTATDPSSLKAEAYSVQGYVLNKKGHPVEDAEIYADNTFLYNSNIIGVTDATGYYQMDLPLANTTYRMSAQLAIEYEGNTYPVRMEPSVNSAFNASSGAVRNFVFEGVPGDVELYSWDYAYPHDENAPEFDLIDVELTLTPVGKLADGSAGEVLKLHGEHHDGIRIKDVPVGKYKVTANWTPEGYAAIPMEISVRNADKFGESTTVMFINAFSDYHHIQLEVQFK